jgi:hypothetical protein
MRTLFHQYRDAARIEIVATADDLEFADFDHSLNGRASRS